MPEEYNGYAAFSAGLDVKPWIYPAKKFEDEDIEIKISHCGICGSDIHVNFHLKVSGRPTPDSENFVPPSLPPFIASPFN